MTYEWNICEIAGRKERNHFYADLVITVFVVGTKIVKKVLRGKGFFWWWDSTITMDYFLFIGDYPPPKHFVFSYVFFGKLYALFNDIKKIFWNSCILHRIFMTFRNVSPFTTYTSSTSFAKFQNIIFGQNIFFRFLKMYTRAILGATRRVAVQQSVRNTVSEIISFPKLNFISFIVNLLSLLYYH